MKTVIRPRRIEALACALQGERKVKMMINIKKNLSNFAAALLKEN